MRVKALASTLVEFPSILCKDCFIFMASSSSLKNRKSANPEHRPITVKGSSTIERKN
uniref:Uncharacterized protein n=1 Tax=Rhizophora mucronata TaxID=61149 RepID=A0A2P2NT42_RHIMU